MINMIMDIQSIFNQAIANEAMAYEEKSARSAIPETRKACEGCGGNFKESALEYGLCEQCRKNTLSRFAKCLEAFTDEELTLITEHWDGLYLEKEDK